MNSALPVMAGHSRRRTASLPLAYVPAIHVFLLLRCFKDVDARDVHSGTPQGPEQNRENNPMHSRMGPGIAELDQLSQLDGCATGILPDVHIRRKPT